MAIALVLNEVPAEPLVARNIILDDRVQTFTVTTVKRWYWRWSDERATMGWQFLGESKVGTELSVTFPFDVTTRQIDVGYVSTTDTGVENVTNLNNMRWTVYPQAPTFTSAEFNTGDNDTDLVFFKNSIGTGNIIVEYKKENDLVWLTHATTFAHNATSGSVTIAQEATSQTWQIRLKQDDIEGVSRTLEVTVNGTGASDTPPTFTSATYDSGNSEIDLVFAKNGTAVGNIQVEHSLTGAGSWTQHATEFAHGATTGSIVIAEQSSAVTYDLKLKQVGVAGYSVTRSVTVDAAPSGPPSNLTASETDNGDCVWSVEVDFDAGAGSGNYTIERKLLPSGSWTVRDSNVVFASLPWTEGIAGSFTTRLYSYRAKQNDVGTYSTPNDNDTVSIGRCDL